MTPVSDVYSRLTVLIEDKTYLKISDEEIEFIFKRFVESAIVLFKELNKDYKPRVIDNIYGEAHIAKTINTEDGTDLDLEEQVILAHGMLIAWHNSQIFKDQFLKQRLNTKDFNQLSNATMLSNNIELHKTINSEFIRMRRRYKNRNWNGDGF